MERCRLSQRIAARRPDCIRLIADGGQRLGASGNFARLMKYADADYMMFCDQDDVWLPSRIEKPLERMKTLEDALGRDVPILVHTDLAVVDEDLRPLVLLSGNMAGSIPAPATAWADCWSATS